MAATWGDDGSGSGSTAHLLTAISRLCAIRLAPVETEGVHNDGQTLAAGHRSASVVAATTTGVGSSLTSSVILYDRPTHTNGQLLLLIL